MSTLIVVDRSGEERSLAARPGYSLMEIIRDSGLEDMLALCGGCCSCATCHVYVDEAFTDRFPSMTKDENALLDSAVGRTVRSRLSCQLKFDASMGGVRVVIAPEE